MAVTITAHQLGRLIGRMIDHISSEHTRLYGLRLEADSTFLYAVASDRDTVAGARCSHQGLDGAPFAGTLLADCLESVREWIIAQPGSALVSVSITAGRMHFTAPRSELAVPATDMPFSGWRGVLRGVIDPERPRCDASQDIADCVSDLLKQTLRSTYDLRQTLRIMNGTNHADVAVEMLAAHAVTAGMAWSAYCYLTALHTADPEFAAAVVADNTAQLDDGAIGELAWDAAESAGHDPQKWLDDFARRRATHRRDDAALPGHDQAVITPW